MAWMEAQDGGDPAVAASPRDIVYCLGADEAAAGAEPRAIAGAPAAGAGPGAAAAPEAGAGERLLPSGPCLAALGGAAGACCTRPPTPAPAPSGLRPRAGTDTRCRGVAWGTADFALLYEAEWKSRRSVTWVIAPDAPDPGATKTVRGSRGWLGGERELARGGARDEEVAGPVAPCGAAASRLRAPSDTRAAPHARPPAGQSAPLHSCPPCCTLPPIHLHPPITPQLLFDRNYEDAYSDPGSPATRRTQWGTYVLALVDGERKLLMQGSGASPEGNK